MILAMVAAITILVALAVSLWSRVFRRGVLSLPPETLEGATEKTESLLCQLEVCNHSATLSSSEDDEQVEEASPHRLKGHETLQKLEKAVPNSTKEERLRFLTARKGNLERTAKSLTSYIDWRSQYETPPGYSLESNPDDIDEWNFAAARALHANGQPVTTLPRVVRIPSNAVCRRGHRIMQFLPGLIDDQIANTKIYSLAIALYCDQKLKRDSMERLCIIVDVRSGFGWPNMPLTGFLSFAKHTISLLLSNFPERLGSALVYPVPSAFAWVWTTIRYFIDSETRKKFALLPGNNTKQSPPPYKLLAEFLDPEVVELIEKERRSSFTENEP
jgi:hypothetical protein